MQLFSYHSISVPPAAHDPDKPIFTALGFLGKLPGGKCLNNYAQWARIFPEVATRIHVWFNNFF